MNSEATIILPPDNSPIVNGYPNMVTGADIATWPQPVLKDFNTMKAYTTARLIGKVNTGPTANPVWENRYVLERHEIDQSIITQELATYENLLKQGGTQGSVFATTRLYLTRTDAGVTVVPNAAWDVTTGNLIWKLGAFDEITTLTTNSGNGNPGQKMLNKTFVSAPLLAQAIQCAVHIQIAGRSSQADPNVPVMRQLIFFRLLNNDGTVASEIGSVSSGLLPNNSVTLLSCPMELQANFPVTAGQRLCFGVGGDYISGTGTCQIRQNLGAMSSRIDLPYGDVQPPLSGAAPNPWIEFSQPLKFQ